MKIVVLLFAVLSHSQFAHGKYDTKEMWKSEILFFLRSTFTEFSSVKTLLLLDILLIFRRFHWIHPSLAEG